MRTQKKRKIVVAPTLDRAQIVRMTAINQLPARIANKLTSITCTKTLRKIRENRLDRKTSNYAIHIRRHHIFLACIDQRVALTNAKRAAFVALCEA